MPKRPAVCAALLVCVLCLPAQGESFIGDAGHFVHNLDLIYMNNPKGEAFTVTVHRHVWPTEWGNKGDYRITVAGPDGAEAAKGAIPSGKASAQIAVPAGTPGVYTLDIQGAGYALTWVECSLPQMVIGTGDWDMKDTPYRTFILHVMAPRRWYFYVPLNTKTFDVKHTVFPFQSHREDYGLFIMSPRGQRMRALFGGKPLDMETKRPNKAYAVVETLETDPGTTGRFWSIWACGGDSHNFSDLQIMLKNVPPYFAPTPEQWFDPRTGLAPERLIYDASQVRMLDKHARKRDASGRRLSRDHYLWTPATFLGDEDYNGMRGPATIYVFNPEARRIDFGICSYIIPGDGPVPVHYRVTGPTGKVVLDKKDTFRHRDSSRITLPAERGGVYSVHVDSTKWFAWTEPAVPMVLAGSPTGDGGRRFPLEIGVDRHWFFKVPKGTEQFTVTAGVANPRHVLSCEIHAPDRMADILYVRGGRPRKVTVRVPSGLDDKLWFFRLGVGSATRFLGDAPLQPQHVRIDADIQLHGVPGYLAPTWSQWFLPPRAAAGGK